MKKILICTLSVIVLFISQLSVAAGPSGCLCSCDTSDKTYAGVLDPATSACKCNSNDAKVKACGIEGEKAAAITESDDVKHWWGGFTLRSWSGTFDVPGATELKRPPSLNGTLALGYDSVFFTFTAVGDTGYMPYDSPTASGLNWRHSEVAYGVGYFVTPAIGVLVGQKSITGTNYNDAITGVSKSGFQAEEEHVFNTLTMLINWSVPDTKAFVFGNYTVGKADYTAGSLSGTLSYGGYELGAGYALWPSVKLTLGYKYEAYDRPYPTVYVAPTPIASNQWAVGTLKHYGPFAGVSYSF